MISTTIKKKISFYTLGCRLNQAETAIIRNSFDEEVFELVDFDTPADIVVINTCTVTENGDADTRRLVAKISRLNPAARIALIGCQAQVQKQKLAELPNVSWVVGNAKKFDLAAIVRELDAPDEPVVITPAIERGSFTIATPGIDKDHRRANLKIQDGCDFFCTFCEIPYARGRARSREFDDILREAKHLADAGHQELVLTGINIGTYSDQNKTILHVIDALEQIENIKRIRISSIEPTTIPHELIDKMAGSTKLCRHLHIPLQSGDNTILASIQRKYTVEEFQAFVEMVNHRIPDVCIGTDIIVGFPGEGEDEFNNTCETFRKLPLHYGHVFSYSKRHLAKSKDRQDGIPPTEIKRRSQVLRDLSERKRRLFYEQQLGKEHLILFEIKKNGIWSGLSDNYIRVTLRSAEPLLNQFHTVLLNGLKGATAEGKLIAPTCRKTGKMKTLP